MTHKIERERILFYGLIGLFLPILLFLLATKFGYTIVSSYFGLNAAYTDQDIVVVALDEATLNSPKFKRYQDITRCDYATLLRNISYGDPKVVAVDAVFYQRSAEVSCDRELQDVLRKNKNIIVGIEYDEKTGKMQSELFGGGGSGGESVAYVNTTSYNSLDVFGLSWSDYRNRVRLYDRTKKPVLPLALEAYKQANKIDTVEIEGDSVRMGGHEIPVDEDGFLNVNFFSESYKSVSFLEVLEGEEVPGIFENKVVFIGATAPDIHDEFLTPFNTASAIPGVVIHANLYNTLSSGRFIEYEKLWMFLLINLLVIGLFTVVLVRTSNILHGIAISIGVIIVYIAYSIVSFQYLGRMVEIFPLLIAYVFVSLSIYLRKFLDERHSKDQVKAIFSRYISEDVANELIKLGIDSMKLGGSEREVSVFFSDLAGFTDLSENLTPEDLGKILNVYFEEMSSIILSERGTIDKFIGDAIMAFWNAPLDLANHADHACEAAIRQRLAMEKVRIAARDLGCDATLDMRIGIHTGRAIIGNFGCSKRYDYTALGDTINLASRLESINKQYGTNVIISESTYQSLSEGKFLVRELDLIAVKGKTEPVKIYELVWLASDTELVASHEIKMMQLYADALTLYRARDFQKARRIFAVIGDAPSRKFMERCEEFILHPPADDWDQVYRFKVK